MMVQAFEPFMRHCKSMECPAGGPERAASLPSWLPVIRDALSGRLTAIAPPMDVESPAIVDRKRACCSSLEKENIYAAAVSTDVMLLCCIEMRL
jgi:hypothetical protein